MDIHVWLNWIAQHPGWAISTVFLVALSESLVVVGLIVPGAVIMVAAGALIGMGVVEFWPVMLVAIVGAVIGDGLSFWVGHRYREQLRRCWPFSRHQEWFVRSEYFLRRHGSKSVLLARFVGPVRPLLPAVAGMLGMSPLKFYRANIVSALIWAPLYLFPGMAFGASLALASEVAARLVVLLLLMVAMCWGLVWLIRWLYRKLSPRAETMARDLLAWGRGHERVNRILGGLLNPSLPELKTLLVLGCMLIAASWIFLTILGSVAGGSPGMGADQAFYVLIQQLRTPWGDRLMVMVTEFGDGPVIATVASVLLLWLIWHRSWHVAGYWLAAIGFGQLISLLFKWLLQRPRPQAGLYEGISGYAFPSGHAAMSMVLYGFLAVLLARRLSSGLRWFAFALAGALIMAIALSRLYLGAHWLSDVVGGLCLGMIWITLLGIAFYRHSPPVPRHLPAVTLFALLLAGAWHVTRQYSEDLQRYAPRTHVQRLDSHAWWQSQWREIPAFRQDLGGEPEQPLNIQWGASLDTVRETLRLRGWQPPPPLNAGTMLRWLQPEPKLAELPVLPQVHDGRHETVLMRLMPSDSDPAAQVVLRLWNSGILLQPDDVPLWVGNVTLQRRQRFLLLTVPITDNQYAQPMARLIRSVEDLPHHKVKRQVAGSAHTGVPVPWDGSVLLLGND